MTEAFKGLRCELSVSVSLCVPCTSDSFILECDACATGIGAVLSVSRGEELVPVAFFSRQLRGAQTKYGAQELEGLALVEAIEHFAFYLYLRKFVVVTEHKSLETLKTAQQRNRRLYRWALKLAEFKFEIHYRPGRQNGVSDCLSRCHGDEEFDSAEVVLQQNDGGEDVGGEVPT